MSNENNKGPSANKYGRQQNSPGDKSHNQTERNADWGNDNRNVDPSEEADRADDRRQSQEKSERSDEEDVSGESKHPDHKKDTQTTLSADPTRKNEANQGASDLRKREHTNFKKEGESGTRRE